MGTEFGGELRNTRAGRQRGRPISTTSGMHVVLRSRQARNAWSFRRVHDEVERAIGRFAEANGVEVRGVAILTNHIHLYLRFPSRQAYFRFIRALAGSIALLVRRSSRGLPPGKPFWDLRPFTRVVAGPQRERIMARYIRINQLEAQGCNRAEARSRAEAEFSSQFRPGKNL